MAKNKSQGGAGGAKHGRNKVKCARYRAEGRAAKNRNKRALKRLNQMPRKEG